MLRLYSLIPTVPILNNIEGVFDEFLLKHGNEYSLTKEKETKTSSSFEYKLVFTEQYINTWKGMIEKEHMPYGIGHIVTALKEVHRIEIIPTGIIQIVLDKIDPKQKQYIKDDLSWHYYILLDKFTKVLGKLGYTLPHVEGTPEPIIPVTYGGGIEIDSLANSINSRLNMILSEGCDVLESDLGKIKSSLEDVAPFLLHGTYHPIVSILSLAVDYTAYTTILGNVIKRNILEIEQKFQKSWEAAYDAAIAVAGFFNNIVEQISLMLRMYSDHMSTVGIYATLMGLGLSVVLAALTFTDGQLKNLTFILGIVNILITGIFWKMSAVTDLILLQLEKLQRYLKLGMVQT